MYRCSSTECAVVETAPLPIHIYVDNSNVWIGAKKKGREMKGFRADCKEDHRVRINYDLLTDAVARGRPVAKGTLYGSEPPKLDPVWEKIRELGWEVVTKLRSHVTKKEKEVDSQIVTDILKLATSGIKPSTIVLISGDGDMYPAVQEIVQKKEGWKIEICTWENILSFRLRQLCDAYENCSFHPLDDHWNVVYTENEFNAHDIPGNSSAVLTIRPGTFSKDQPVYRNDPVWWDELEKIAQWPVQYRWIKDKADSLLLVFRRMEEKETRSLVKRLNNQETHILSHVQSCELYADYSRREINRSRRSSESSSGTGWLVTPRRRQVNPALVSPVPSTAKSPPKPTVSRSLQSCCSGKNCDQGLDCRYSHTADHVKFFRSRKDRKGNPLQKTRLCKVYPHCSEPSIRCSFAHGELDGWCSNCHKQGHFRHKCQNAACTHPRHRES
jgi:hypothetical protein